MRTRIVLITAALLLAVSSPPAWAADHEFRLSFPEQVRGESYSGRVYLFFSPRSNAEPRRMDWFHPSPIVALDVENWKPGEPLSINASTPGLIAFPKPLADLGLAGHRVQALARFNPLEPKVGVGAGNGFSKPADVPASAGAPLELAIDSLIPETPFPENRWFKELAVKSRLLSDFAGREVFVRGSVLLPASYYDAPERRYPVIFEIPGFGGTHIPRPHAPQEPVKEQNEGGVEFLRVMLDPSCPLGHHVFADSANNGPWNRALIAEFIPELDRQFRTVAEPAARFLTGHSSGGWSSLWLQVTHPEFFAGTWSTSPDPVDFRDFQRIDLYREGENMYRDHEGNRRPLARQGDRVLLWYDDFDHIEELLGPGGQLHSFEAAFSPRGPDGRPRRAWDRRTGAVDREVTGTWKKYDIQLVLESRWDELGPKLAGNLHVFMGELDTFYLEGATRLLKESLGRLKSDATVELVPGRNHFDLLTPDLVSRIRREMVQSYLKNRPATGAR